MLRLHNSYWRSASSRGVPMNQTAPLKIIWFTSSPLTCAARGSNCAATRGLTVDFPAPGIPDTMTHPDNSAALMSHDAPTGTPRQDPISRGYMPKCVRCTAATASAGPVTSTCAARWPPEDVEEEVAGRSAEPRGRLARPHASLARSVPAHSISSPAPRRRRPRKRLPRRTLRHNAASSSGVSVRGLHPVGPPHVFVMHEELVEVGKRTDPADAEEPRRRARPDPRHEPREVAAFREPDPPPLGESPERARERDARAGDQIALAEDDVRGEVVRGPSLEQRGNGWPELVEHVAELLSLLRVEVSSAHPGVRRRRRTGRAGRRASAPRSVSARAIASGLSWLTTSVVRMRCARSRRA